MTFALRQNVSSHSERISSGKHVLIASNRSRLIPLTLLDGLRKVSVQNESENLFVDNSYTKRVQSAFGIESDPEFPR